ncbi:MAG: Maf family protein [bacterium]|nr:Maf family protein [bacterium]
MRRIILASRSASRRALLRRIGLPFTTARPAVPESRRARGGCRALVVSNALRKARDVARRVRSGLVIGADTVVVEGGRTIGKPRTAAAAAAMLRRLAGRTQWVYTGLAVVDAESGRASTACERTKVVMRRMRPAQIRTYVRRASPRLVSGGLDVSGPGAAFVERIEGCFTNVLGLPLARLAALLDAAGAGPVPPPVRRRARRPGRS